LSKFSKYPSFFLGKKEKRKNCYDLGIDHNLTEFAKIPIHEFLKILIIFLKKYRGILRILIVFNRKL
jgi:hypothetical protein